MRSYERNRVVVDQCTACGGLFLDRGELEALQNAESAYYGAAAAVPAGPQDRGYGDQRYDPAYGGQRYDDSRRDEHYRFGKRKKKSSFLSELFDD